MNPSFLPSGGDTNGGTRPIEFRVPIRRAAKRGAVVGLVVGLLALAGVLVVVEQCLPFHISFPPLPWPWYCSDPAYGAVGYLAFPVNLLTNDLARGIPLAPLSLLMYVLLGTLLGSALGASRSSPPRK